MATPKDFEQIAQVLQNYDSIELSNEKSNFRNGQGENAPIILYRKKVDSHTQIVAEAVTDGKKGNYVLYQLIKPNWTNEKSAMSYGGRPKRIAYRNARTATDSTFYYYYTLPQLKSQPLKGENLIWNSTNDKFYNHTGLELSRLTHKEDSPWAKTLANGIIKFDEIKDYFQHEETIYG